MNIKRIGLVFLIVVIGILRMLALHVDEFLGRESSLIPEAGSISLLESA